MLMWSHSWLLSTWTSLSEARGLGEYRPNRHTHRAMIFKHLVTYFCHAPCTLIHTIYLSLLPPVIPHFPQHHFSTFLPPPLPSWTCETGAMLGKRSTRTCACLDCDRICNVRYGCSTLLHRTHHDAPLHTITYHDTSTHHDTITHHSPWHTIPVHTSTPWHTSTHHRDAILLSRKSPHWLFVQAYCM